MSGSATPAPAEDREGDIRLAWEITKRVLEAPDVFPEPAGIRAFMHGYLGDQEEEIPENVESILGVELIVALEYEKTVIEHWGEQFDLDDDTVDVMLEGFDHWPAVDKLLRKSEKRSRLSMIGTVPPETSNDSTATIGGNVKVPTQQTAKTSKSKTGRGHKRVNARMLEHVQKAGHECSGWGLKEWARFLGCSIPAVAKAQTWQDLQADRKKLKPLLRPDRHHRTKPI